MDSTGLHGILFVVIVIDLLLSSTQGAPTLSVDENPSNYSSSATLRCSDSTYVSGNGYSWKKNGVTIFNNAGETLTTGKYSGDIDGTTLKLIINDLVVADEDTYLCNHLFQDSNLLDLVVESKGTVTAELSSSSSGKLEVTFNKIYPSPSAVVITCDSIQETGNFVSNETDGDRFTIKWESKKNFTSVPSGCSVEVALVTTFNIAFDVISATKTPEETDDNDQGIKIGVGVGVGVGGGGGLFVIIVVVIVRRKKGSTTTLTFVEGSKVTFSCPFPESVAFPEWRGPPGLTIYTILDDTSETINSKIPAFNRLQYASNKRDLILSNAVIGDSGDYKCSYTGQGDHTFTLKVNRGKGDKASNVVNTGSHPDEKKKQGRPQPPPPGANHRQLPDIHDRKGRGLSANYTDDDHPLVSINIPTKKPGALESIPDSAREEVTKKKKKKKKKRVETEDDQSD